MTAEEAERLLNASRFEKAEYKRHTKYWDAIIATYKEVVDHYENRISELKRERKERSAALQQWLFDNFVFRNIDGEVASLSHIFSNTTQGVPPAGAGECAAPKILQYAFLNGLRPIAMAEFWMGESPIGEVRRDGCFYGSCTSKCKPILGFMLRGMDVEKSVLEQRMSDEDIEVLYDDDYLCVVNKPSGMLSVPGVVGGVSLEEHLQSKYGSDAYIRVVHRLDMFTSGLLVVAKSSEVYIALQRQFADREVLKRYSALLDGVIDSAEGEISLPLSADYENRPRQRVDKASGKSAVTKYGVVSEVTYKGRRCTHVHFFPLTGRTHQLRMHAAHFEGLNCPIVGDELYGVPDERLMLHAEYICFKHPVSGCNIELEIPFKLHE
ncbi:MAG: RluA family pseudouridine synthase [Bacteroidaceae bacterium]|nr:RluA family pseudouridine synthase [Bacteroidaceae bacterium]